MAGKVTYDDILKHIGQFGKWQKRIHFWLWLASAASGLVVVVYSFTAFSMDYRCRNPYCEDINGKQFIQNKSLIELRPKEACQYFQTDFGLAPPSVTNSGKNCFGSKKA